jgi:hypothetical protein
VAVEKTLELWKILSRNCLLYFIGHGKVLCGIFPIGVAIMIEQRKFSDESVIDEALKKPLPSQVRVGEHHMANNNQEPQRESSVSFFLLAV